MVRSDVLVRFKNLGSGCFLCPLSTLNENQNIAKDTPYLIPILCDVVSSAPHSHHSRHTVATLSSHVGSRQSAHSSLKRRIYLLSGADTYHHYPEMS